MSFIESDTEIIVTVGTRVGFGCSGGDDCSDPRPVQLDEPLGDRQILDADGDEIRRVDPWLSESSRTRRWRSGPLILTGIMRCTAWAEVRRVLTMLARITERALCVVDVEQCARDGAQSKVVDAVVPIDRCSLQHSRTGSWKACEIRRAEMVVSRRRQPLARGLRRVLASILDLVVRR